MTGCKATYTGGREGDDEELLAAWRDAAASGRAHGPAGREAAQALDEAVDDAGEADEIAHLATTTATAASRAAERADESADRLTLRVIELRKPLAEAEAEQVDARQEETDTGAAYHEAVGEARATGLRGTTERAPMNY